MLPYSETGESDHALMGGTCKFDLFRPLASSGLAEGPRSFSGTAGPRMMIFGGGVGVVGITTSRPGCVSIDSCLWDMAPFFFFFFEHQK